MAIRKGKCHCGGRKRAYTVPGRRLKRKMYNDYCREQRGKGLAPDGRGSWMSIDNIGDKTVQSGYKAQLGNFLHG